jgi:hypothetical protein
MKPVARAYLCRWFAWAVMLTFAVAPLSAQTRDPEAGVSFEEITKKFIRNMELLKTMSHDAELTRQIGIVVAKAEDLHRIGIQKNADGRRSQIMRQKERMLKREGIKQMDQNALDKLQQELRDLDPDGSFNKARGEMNRALGEFENSLGQVLTPDAESQDVVRLLRIHANYYRACLAKLP